MGPVKRRALELGLQVEQPPTLRTQEAQDRLRSFAPDIMVVVAYGMILPQAVLDAPKLGCLNIHASLLPRWRGAAPIQRAVLAGDAMTGISIMLMDAGLDTGPELLRKQVGIGARETGGELHDRLAPLGAAAIVEAVAGWAAGHLSPQRQPEAGVTYAAKIRKEEARIDWAQPAVVIDRQVRAFNPWPVAETRLEGEQVRVWLAEPAPAIELPAHSQPGQVLDSPEGRLLVATGAGVLELLVLQFPGRKALKARDILNSRSMRGARFAGVVS
jgi:methionyl-tRNA formyltransferase